jgi:hypothetical protein
MPGVLVSFFGEAEANEFVLYCGTYCRYSL